MEPKEIKKELLAAKKALADQAEILERLKEAEPIKDTRIKDDYGFLETGLMAIDAILNKLNWTNRKLIAIIDSLPKKKRAPRTKKKTK